MRVSPSVTLRPRNTAQWLGLAVCWYGLAVLVAFAAHHAALLRIQIGRDASESLADGICLVLAGISLVLAGCRMRGPVRAARALGAVLLAFSGLGLAENLGDVNLGIDLPRLHFWLADPVLRPGRIAANASLGFLLFALAMAMWPHRLKVWTHLRCLKYLAVLVAVIAASGLLGYSIHSEAIFTVHGVPGMAFYTGAALLALAAGLWLEAVALPGLEVTPALPGARIVNVAAAVVIVAVACAGVTSIVLVWRVAESNANTNLALRRDERAAYIAALIASARERGVMYARSAALVRDLSGRPGIRQLSLPSPQFQSVTLYDDAGRVHGVAGTPILSPAIVVPIAPQDLLLWHNGFFLRQILPVGGHSGAVTIEQPVPLLATIGVESSIWGRSGEMGLCGVPSPRDGLLECFPQRLRPRPFVVTRALFGSDRPMSLALDGRTGVIQSADYRGQRIFAAFTPIPGARLGLVVKMDTQELFAVVRHQIELMVPLLVALVLAGLKILSWQMRPLVHGLALMAQNDPLTGLPNRRAFLPRLQHAMLRSQRLRTQSLLALLYLDLDNFKEVNDTRGHAEGDRVLRAFAGLLLDCVRHADIVARLSGDEFTVLLENLDTVEDAERVVQAIFAALRARLGVNCSIGVAFYQGADLSPEELLHRADAALYEAKRAGRNQHRIQAA